jgi:hypothetical protein
MPPMFSTNGDASKPWQSSPNREPILIPVQHVSSNSGEGLRSPSVLNTLRQPSLTRDQVSTLSSRFSSSPRRL